VRTTIKIDDALLAEARLRAAAHGRMLNEVVEDALRETFARRTSDATHIELPVFPGSRLQPGVDLDDSAALLALMHERD
jgi:plasmid stability protein